MCLRVCNKLSQFFSFVNCFFTEFKSDPVVQAPTVTSGIEATLTCTVNGVKPIPKLMWSTSTDSTLQGRGLILLKLIQMEHGKSPAHGEKHSQNQMMDLM